jgi:hypothetical protein
VVQRPPLVLVGLIRVREHCIFTWQEPEGSAQRSVKILPSHCAECIAEIRRLGYNLTDA